MWWSVVWYVYAGGVRLFAGRLWLAIRDYHPRSGAVAAVATGGSRTTPGKYGGWQDFHPRVCDFSGGVLPFVTKPGSFVYLMVE